YREDIRDWPETFGNLIREKSVTDLVLYGDTRPIHALAIQKARQLNLRVHVFEEGYLRPYWVTYERDGCNGHSKLMGMGLSDMSEALQTGSLDEPAAPAHWGEMRHHIFYGALYHFFVLFLNQAYPKFQHHRPHRVQDEFRQNLRKLFWMPLSFVRRGLATLQIQASGVPYHLVLLQLQHDSALQAHSPFANNTEFLDQVLCGFAQGAPGHHQLVVKAHPLEQNGKDLSATLKNLAEKHQIIDRLRYIEGGKLAKILRQARSAVTVNSTAGQQALWRGIPLKLFGDAVYAKPEFTSSQEISDFFAAPRRPDTQAYHMFRRYLLETSQIAGGFYSRKARRQIIRAVVDMMLSHHDP
ncbi:MAG: capsular biosynthesis protein, partial [Paracoccaceae bacterium]